MPPPPPVFRAGISSQRRRVNSGQMLRGIRVVLLLGWLSVKVTAAVDESPPPEVLIINSYAQGYEWSDDQLAGILSMLRTQYPAIEPVIQHLDYRRFPNAAREQWLIEEVAHKTRVRPPQLIVTVDNAAFDFALNHRSRLGSEVPIVFSGLNRFMPEMLAGQSNITGVAEESDFSGTFELISHLRPRARRVLVICSDTTSSQESRAAFEIHARHHASRYSFEFYDRWTNDELINRVASLPDEWVGLILDVTRDSTGHNNYNNGAFTTALATRSRVPLFLTSRPPGDNDWSILPWDGIGGGMIVAEVHGAKVGELALRVLGGEDADSIPVVPHSPQRLEVDYRQMKRFGLSLDLLPERTSVINTPSTFYQVNRSRLILAGIVGLLLVGAIVILSLNILRRRRAERALRKAEEHLRSSQKLEAIGLLAGGVAHDFNNILQVIRGHAEFLRATVSGTPQLEDVEIIQDAAKRATQLTRQLLAFSRKQPLKRELVDPNALVSEMVSMLRRLLGEHIDVQVMLLEEACMLIADKSQLEQVLLNLVVNARDAMPTGGRIHIKLHTTRINPRDENDQAELGDGPYLILTVSDNGCGMPPKVVARLFEPFFTTKDLGKGTGMGLAVAYGIVRQHGGTIRVYSEVGSGSVFKVMLPISNGIADQPQETSEAVLTKGGGTILLAEDDAQVRGIAVRILNENGFRVLSAVDGEEALRLIDRHHAVISLAVLDLIMPRRNGREVFDYMQKHHPTIPVLFCSGYGAEMLPPESAPDAGRALINKPYSPRELLTQIHRLQKARS